MEPYYKDEWVSLYHGDATEVVEWLAADVLVTDPPYGVAFRSARRKAEERFAAISGDDNLEIRDAVLSEWGDRPALVFGTWRRDRPTATRQRLVWAKGEDPGLGDLKMPWGYGDEEIYVLGNGWVGSRRTNVYRFPKVASSNNPGHPTPKPVPLMEALIEHIPATWTISDPFAGSGATLIAARNLGRRAIGVELEEKYCEVIAKRMQTTPLPLAAQAAQHTTSTAMFDLEPGGRVHPGEPELRSSGWSRVPE